MTQTTNDKKKIAVVGTGISGLASAWLLAREHEVTVFEKDDRIGGHSHTVVVPEGTDEVPVDTGFMVYNEVTYPLLTRLFEELDVKTKPTSMSFSVSHTRENVEFNGGSLNLLFGQRRNLLRPRFWKMLLQIDRFNRETVIELATRQYDDMPLAEYVKARGYGDDFLIWYLSPMAAAVWSSPPERINEFPARMLMRFWHNHGFLGLDTQHPWRTVAGGSRKYVEKLAGSLAGSIHQNSNVVQVLALAEGRSRLILKDGSHRDFDKVVFASHADQSLGLLEEPTPLESAILPDFRYQSNEAVLHTDPKFMPQTRRCWASWNYRVEADAEGRSRHSTHYWMNSLQGVSKNCDYFVSINPSQAIEPDKVKRRLHYEHPLFDLRAIASQQRIPELHAAGAETGRYFCGAWQRYGFHEDGLWSAVNACEALLGKNPWP